MFSSETYEAGMWQGTTISLSILPYEDEAKGEST
jgi:hypothetical protein